MPLAGHTMGDVVRGPMVSAAHPSPLGIRTPPGVGGLAIAGGGMGTPEHFACCKPARVSELWPQIVNG